MATPRERELQKRKQRKRQTGGTVRPSKAVQGVAPALNRAVQGTASTLNRATQGTGAVLGRAVENRRNTKRQGAIEADVAAIRGEKPVPLKQRVLAGIQNPTPVGAAVRGQTTAPRPGVPTATSFTNTETPIRNRPPGEAPRAPLDLDQPQLNRSPAQRARAAEQASARKSAEISKASTLEQKNALASARTKERRLKEVAVGKLTEKLKRAPTANEVQVFVYDNIKGELNGPEFQAYARSVGKGIADDAAKLAKSGVEAVSGAIPKVAGAVGENLGETGKAFVEGVTKGSGVVNESSLLEDTGAAAARLLNEGKPVVDAAQEKGAEVVEAGKKKRADVVAAGREKAGRVVERGRLAVKNFFKGEPGGPGIVRRGVGGIGKALAPLAPIEAGAVIKQFQTLRESGLSRAQATKQLVEEFGEGVLDLIKDPVGETISQAKGLPDSTRSAEDVIGRFLANEGLSSGRLDLRTMRPAPSSPVALNPANRDEATAALARHSTLGTPAEQQSRQTALANIRERGGRLGNTSLNVAEADEVGARGLVDRVDDFFNAPAQPGGIRTPARSDITQAPAQPGTAQETDQGVQDLLGTIQSGIDKGAPIADLRVNPRTGITSNQLPQGTGFIQRNQDGTPIPGRGSVLDLRRERGQTLARQAERASARETRAPTQDKSRFDLRQFLSSTEATPQTASIAAGALNLNRSLNRRPSAADQVSVANAQTNFLKAKTAQAAQEGAITNQQFEQTSEIIDDLLSEDPRRAELAIPRAFTMAARGNDLAGDALRGHAANLVREELEPGLLRQLLPRKIGPIPIGGAERGGVDAIISYIEGTPNVNLTGIFKEYSLDGDVLKSPDGQDIANLGDVGGPAVAQLIRTFVQLDNPQQG